MTRQNQAKGEASSEDATPDWATTDSSDGILLFKFALLALTLEVILFTVLGWRGDELSHTRKSDLSSMKETQFIEAQVFQLPEQAHLTEEKKLQPLEPKRAEPTLSKIANQGADAPKTNSPLEEKNQTQTGHPMALTHGPVAVHAPAPVIPSYLQDKEIKTHVVIDFYVNSLGSAVPRLAGSSGHEELDAIALNTVKKWIFRPAETDGKPVDAKVRLRIVFVVQ
jgi:TonB family protein